MNDTNLGVIGALPPVLELALDAFAGAFFNWASFSATFAAAVVSP